MKQLTAKRFNQRARLRSHLLLSPPGERLLQRVRNYLIACRFALKVDRRYMENQILPALQCSGLGRIAFVGSGPYTYHYGRWFDKTTTEYWTLDIDPAEAKWGEQRGRHKVCDIKIIDSCFPTRFFDVILLNGVLGAGLNDLPQINEALIAIHNVLKTNGLLLIGWNRDWSHNPMGIETIRSKFRHAAVLNLQAHVEFPETDHTYDWFVAR